MKILLVEDDENIRDLIMSSVQKILKVPMLTVSSLEDAKEVFQKDTTYNCVICDHKPPQINAANVYSAVKSANKDTHFILCSSTPLEKIKELAGLEIAGTVIKPHIIDSLVKMLSSLLHIQDTSTKDTKKDEEDIFSDVKLTALLRIADLPCDVYLRINEKKHIKVLKTNSIFDTTTLEHFQAKRIRFLQVRVQDLDLITEKLAQSISSMENLKNVQTVTSNIDELSIRVLDKVLKDELVRLSDVLKSTKVEDADFETLLGVTNTSLSVIQKAIKQLGVTREVENLIKSTVNLSISNLSNLPSLKDLFDRMRINKKEYIHAHSVLLSQMACAIASMVGWNSELTFYKLSLAAFLHDITLDNHELAKLKNMEELMTRMDEFTPEEQKAFETHAKDSAALVRKIHEIPPDVDFILEQHHDLHEENSQISKITPISAAFMIAHDFVDFIFENGGNIGSLDEFLSQSARRYTRGEFKKIYASISKFPTDLGGIKMK